METRLLTEADASAYRRVRLRTLRDHPDLFGGRAYEEAQSLEQMVQTGEAPDHELIWGDYFLLEALARWQGLA